MNTRDVDIFGYKEGGGVGDIDIFEPSNPTTRRF